MVLSAQWFAPSQASESGSTDDPQSTVLEWQEMVSEAVSSRDRAREEKASMALRISHLEEEREGKREGAMHPLQHTSCHSAVATYLQVSG